MLAWTQSTGNALIGGIRSMDNLSVQFSLVVGRDTPGQADGVSMHQDTSMASVRKRRKFRQDKVMMTDDSSTCLAAAGTQRVHQSSLIACKSRTTFTFASIWSALDKVLKFGLDKAELTKVY